MSIQTYGSEKRLYENQRYTIRFSLSGETKTWTFTSRYNPLYSSVKVLRNDFPELFEEIKDDVLNFHIWQASDLAVQLVGGVMMGEQITTIDTSSDAFVNGKPGFAIKQFVRYKAEYDIVRNILLTLSSKAGSEEKQLGQFTVTQEFKTPDIEAILKELGAELKKWEGAMGYTLQNRGAVRAKSGTSGVYPLNKRVSF